MIFTQTQIKGVYLLDLELRADQRGFFARTYCAREFAEHGLKTTIAQCNTSYNYAKGTLRGLHYQLPPSTEAKLIRCVRGAIYDVIVDLRPDSPTYLQHVGVELTAENRRAVYIPDMCANGYQALTDHAEVIYQVSEFYAPELERGIRYDDAVFGIAWPLPVEEISEKDAAWPPFERSAVGVGA